MNSKRVDKWIIRGIMIIALIIGVIACRAVIKTQTSVEWEQNEK